MKFDLHCKWKTKSKESFKRLRDKVCNGVLFFFTYINNIKE